MTFEQLIALAPQVVPLLPRLEKAASTIERIMADPDVKDAVAAFEELAAILQKAQQAPST